MSDMKVIFNSEKVKLFVSKFGQLSDEKSGQCFEVQKFTWETTNRFTFEVITLDAAIVSIRTPDKDFIPDEVILCSGTLKAYLHYASQNLSCSVQCAALKRHTDVSQRIWLPYVSGSDLILTNVILADYRNLMIRVRFSVSFNNFVQISYQVVSDRAGPFETTHRFVLNLGGRISGHFGTYDHVVQMNAEEFYKVKGKKVWDTVSHSMANDLADLRVAQHVGMAIYRSEQNGFNGIYRLAAQNGMDFNVRLIQARKRRVMEIHSDFSWVHFSTLDDLPEITENIVPFYACIGIRNIEQIFDMDELVNSVVKFVEGEDSGSELVASGASCDTVDESDVRYMIDDLLLKDLEEKIEALKDAGLLGMKETRDIIIDLIIMSLDQISEFTADSDVIDEDEVRIIIEEMILKAVASSTVSILSKTKSSDSELDDVTISDEEVLNAYQKHGGILVQLSKTPFFKTCKNKSLFSLTGRIRKPAKLVNHNRVLLKFGLCKNPFNKKKKSISSA
ncbi:uncharacterized protein LOC131429299 [Malaya genurostris]|uniref:uncharacterized protein LOC131429299 n=1 Tax=Malaya genurostris TaxID=325434 RepID=UPI0026F3C4AD|nr:uncharacterized protein LOC131429299 [Malaya genurostris]